ncbi:MAG: hypothetical protein ACLT76_00455 [Clostridium fessum]
MAEHFELPIEDHRMLDSIAKEKVWIRACWKNIVTRRPASNLVSLARNASGFSSSLENNPA